MQIGQPRSLYAKVNLQRVIGDDSWAKLLWAGLNLSEADLPSSWKTRHFYPLTMMRAVTLVQVASCAELAVRMDS